jgi:hypothetical protein
VTDPSKTAIAVVLDRSGSMQTLRGVYQDSLNEFLNEQRQLGDATFTLVQFDTQVETVHLNTPISGVGDIELKPRGRTALYDAMGATIVMLGEQLAGMQEGDRPGNVIVAVLTDGFENASRDWTHERLQAAIKEQTDVYKWQFLYLSAEPRAYQHAADLGIGQDFVVNYRQSYVGTQAVSQAMGQSVNTARRGQYAGVDPDLKRKAEEG